ncbi:MAG: threonine-phosphate decarboxylase [Sulfuritalea sp.]|jgi:cobalamin biosynthetic protein CobC|nr:threonine-phosphate decarboxylase [Sulfuritalea sp.]MBK8761301.1 threonine-phosphate decarboxylase [Sulfuritalea sp.]MBK9349080.1 threonine-phosphate decarboxylase [Sulfuritalea sp.]MBP6693090.1 threonine-phosphate decarboxylase [Xanthomonadales bacterium]
MLEHGGRLRSAAAHWDIPLAEWLDLSTGIAPWSYPVRIDESAWRRLPEDDDELVAAAADYYGHPQPLPLPGSQAAIRELPRLLGPGVAVLPAPTYGEYAPAWRAAGHEVRELDAEALMEVGDAGVVMLANPNNPDGACFAPDALCALAARQAARGGWLVVDEAFADCTPDNSVAALAGSELPNLVVLRSLGKFFGLAGARVGFLCAAPALRARLAEALGPWALAHPSRIAATQALRDTAWQQAQRARLVAASERLGRLLAGHGLASRAGGELFHYVATPLAPALAEHCARRGILLREFQQPPALRFGLPGSDAEWLRLAQALDEFDWTRS